LEKGKCSSEKNADKETGVVLRTMGMNQAIRPDYFSAFRARKVVACKDLWAQQIESAKELRGS